MSTTPRDILNRVRWGADDLDALELVVVHRGAPGDRRRLPGTRIAHIRAGGVEIRGEGDEVGFVPYHRFVAIEHGSDGTLWQRGAAGDDARMRNASTGGAEADGPWSEPLPSTLEVARDVRGLLTLDGSAGEGGGQILRTALTLSALLGRPFAVDNVRAGRRKPGLLRQHLTALRAAGAVCGAEVKGAALGSRRFTFHPGAIAATDLDLDIGSAGSVALVLHTIAWPLAAAAAPSHITLRGGTHARYAPIAPFLEHAWLPHLTRIGVEAELTLERAGFYPAGGGCLTARIAPWTARQPVNACAAPSALRVHLHAAVSRVPDRVAERELRHAETLLAAEGLSAASRRIHRPESPGPGNAMWIVAEDARTGQANVVSAIGERGVRAEQVAEEAVDALIAWRASGASVCPYLADQLMLPIALAGGAATCGTPSLHAWTNLEVIAAFTGVRLTVRRDDDGRHRIANEVAAVLG